MSKNSTRLRVACVGAGYFSQFHYGSWARIDRVELVGSCDHNIENAKATGLPSYSDLEHMLEDTSPDLLDIILPPVAHTEVIRTALRAGVRTMICQKPFCCDLEQATEIDKEAEAVGATIIIHENFRFQPWYRRIKQVLDEGAIGKVHQLTFRLRPGDGQGPEAYLDRQPYFQKMEKFLIHETAVHWVDTFRYLLGNPVAVYADLRQLNPSIAGEDEGYVLFDHASGVRALFDGNRHLDHAAENHRCTMGEALIEGTEGTLQLFGDGSVRLRKFQAIDEEEVFPAEDWSGFGGDCVHALQNHVVFGLFDGSEIENIARDYLQVLRIEEEIYLSAQTGTKRWLERPD